MDYLNGKIAIESVNCPYGLDFDHIEWINILKIALFNGWDPSGRDPDKEISSDCQVGEFPVITEMDAYSLMEILEKVAKESMESIYRETEEEDFTKAMKKASEEMPWVIPYYDFDDLCELFATIHFFITICIHIRFWMIWTSGKARMT